MLQTLKCQWTLGNNGKASRQKKASSNDILLIYQSALEMKWRVINFQIILSDLQVSKVI